jgi:hypothetical protein
VQEARKVPKAAFVTVGSLAESSEMATEVHAAPSPRAHARLHEARSRETVQWRSSRRAK